MLLCVCFACLLHVADCFPALQVSQRPALPAALHLPFAFTAALHLPSQQPSCRGGNHSRKSRPDYSLLRLLRVIVFHYAYYAYYASSSLLLTITRLLRVYHGYYITTSLLRGYYV